MSHMPEKKQEFHCKFFVARKKRYCKMTVKLGQEFCGEHQKPADISEVTEDSSSEDRKLRIVCPLDRKHTCYAHNLKKHLKICNARQTVEEPYIIRGVNSGKQAYEIDNLYKLLSTFSVPDVKAVIDKVNNIYERSIKNNITTKILTNKLVEEEMLKPVYGDKTKKHLKQASSILGLLNEYNMIKPGTCFIEFGAGRGQLSFWIAKATESDERSSILLIERASPKHKRDNKLLKTTDKVLRIRADISDLVLDKLDIISKTIHVVGVTKHLCGEATDLALRCLANVKDNKAKLNGAVLTFCCHHRCRWVPYTGKEFFEENNLSKSDFDIMCGMASWATCGTGFSRDRRKNMEETVDMKQNDRDNEIGLSREEKEEVGRRSKSVLNWGRLVFLEKFGFKCALHYYVDKNVSLENVCVVAYR